MISKSYLKKTFNNEKQYQKGLHLEFSYPTVSTFFLFLHFLKFFGGIVVLGSPLLINERVYGDHCCKVSFYNKNQYR